MKKQRKIILIIWAIFISIILIILLFLLGLKLSKSKQLKTNNNQIKTQPQSQYQYIYDTNKLENIIVLMNALKRLKTLKQLNSKTTKKTEYQDDNELQSQPKLNDNVISSNNHNINQKDANRILGLGLIALTLPPFGFAATAKTVIAFLPLLL